MTTGPDSPERDPALERAWRAHSREGPPAALDRAILAAAHRAVGSGPAKVEPAREANRPQRWWMPLAAAATIGAVAVGLLQLSPRDESLVAPTERVAAVAPQRELAKAAPAGTPEAPAADVKVRAATPEARAPAAGAQARAAPDTPARPVDNERAATRRQDAPAAAPASPPPTAAPSAAEPTHPARPRPAAPLPAPRPPPAAPPPLASTPPAAPPPLASTPPASTPSAVPAPAAPAARMDAAREAPAVVGTLAGRAPEPFPAAPAPRSAQSTEMKSVAPAADVAASAGTVQALREEQASAPAAAVAQDKRELARKDFAEADRRQAAAEAPGARAPVPAATSASSSLAAPPAPALPPQPSVGAMRARENAFVRDASREQAAPDSPALAKRATPAEDARTKARDPDAWIARIRKLRDEGRTAEAIRELREFREFVPDAQRRIPEDLRELAASIRP